MIVAVVVLALVALGALACLAWQSVVHRRERAELYQRIQAPHVAVTEVASGEKRPPAKVISAADDKAFADAKGIEVEG